MAISTSICTTCFHSLIRHISTVVKSGRTNLGTPGLGFEYVCKQDNSAQGGGNCSCVLTQIAFNDLLRAGVQSTPSKNEEYEW